jgi:[ribosomal protein S5]-alanine N-acetyltransferase
MEFHLDKCKLRPWQIEDALSIAKYANNKKIADHLRDGFPYPYTLHDAKSWLKFALSSKDLLLAIEVDSEAIGSVGIIYKNDIYRKTAEIGYWLGEPHWGKGIMSSVIPGLTKHIFANTEIIRIYAGVFENNKASARTLIKAGFKYEATHKNAVIKNGIVMDENIYALLK